jgi:hypothetical protein
MSTDERAERERCLDAAERRARGLVCACRAFGDARGLVQARRDLASIGRARRVLAGEAVAVTVARAA